LYRYNEEGDDEADEVDVTGGAAAAEAEAEGCVGTAAAEALVKLVLRRGSGALASAPHVVVGLCKLNPVDPQLESVWFQPSNL
jgi:hypothetical protein